MAAAALSVTLIFSARMIAVNQHHLQVNMAAFNIDGLRTMALGALTEQHSWNLTIANNPDMACAQSSVVSCPALITHGEGILINLHGPDGRRLVDKRRFAGFTTSGVECDDFDENGNDRCPLRLEVRWRLECGGSPCRYPNEVVTVVFRYAPKNADPLIGNVARFNIVNFNRRGMSQEVSPVVACAAMNQTFIGFGKSVTGGSGIVTAANSMGCVPVSAFKGRTGFRGLIGDTGPRGPVGPRGPRGPAGVAYPAGTSPTSMASGPGGPGASGPGGPGGAGGPGAPTGPGIAAGTGGPLVPEGTDPATMCSTYPQICQWYLQYLNRYPEPAGAAYWASSLADGVSPDVIEEYFQLVAAGGDRVVEGLDEIGVWNDIAARKNLPTGFNGEFCTNAVECTSLSAEAHAEYSQVLDAYCAANPSKCYIVYGGNAETRRMAGE